MSTVPADVTSLDEPYELSPEQIQQFREEGFIKLKNVFDQSQLDYFGEAITRMTLQKAAETAKVPMEERSTYAQAFLQVGNLWEEDDTCRAFSFGKRIARIATELMGTRGVRMYHDQALYKEAGGGFTPWHCDQQYWPLSTGMSVTAWIPLQAVPMDMGPLCFGKGSHVKNIGRDLVISDESEKLIRDAIKEQGVIEVMEPFELGEISFHYGWTLHRAGPNTSGQPRKVHTVIYIDQDMKLAEPKRDTQQNDWDRWSPSTKIGEVMADPLNPILYSTAD